MKTFKVIAVTILITLFWINYSQAISIDFVPSNQTVQLGQKVVVYLHISGLEPGDLEDQKVRAFDIDIGFDNQILKFKKVQFGSQLGDPSDDNETNANLLMDDIMDGWFGISEVSKLGTPELNQLQGFCVTVVKIVFRAKKVGTTSVYGDGYYVKDQNGSYILGSGGNFSPQSATVNVVKGKRFLPDSF
jgi:hypothetical protein